VGKGLETGGKALLDGRNPKVENGEKGAFLNPTILSGIGPDNELSGTEIFGPVLSMQPASTLDEAIQILSRSRYGNAASIFTSDGNAARKFRYEAPAGNIGVNIGVAAPMAYFPFSGWKDSFLGVLHGQGRDGVEFFTDKKVVIERWPREWSRKF
jgi:malonate-semialdehyde dehydrogenase (acetylating)/methylmalonate-semialdehyde dehydrogenase